MTIWHDGATQSAPANDPPAASEQHEGTLQKLAHCEFPQNQDSHNHKKPTHNAVAIIMDMLPTLLPSNTRLETLSMLVCHTPNLNQNCSLPSLIHPQSTCAIPHPPISRCLKNTCISHSQQTLTQLASPSPNPPNKRQFLSSLRDPVYNAPV